MKKLLALCAAALIAFSAMAADLRIYASRLAVSVTDNVATLSYVLNENATALELQLLNATTDAVEATVAITEPTALTKGEHNAVMVNLNNQTAGTYKWALKATADALTEVKIGNDLTDPGSCYYGPRGIQVDNNPANATFGNIYVSNALAGASDGTTATSKTSTLGIYMLNAAAQTTNTNNVGYAGGVSWSGGSASPYRIALDEAGMLYIANCNNTDGNVYMMNPANPTADFTPVLATAGYKSTYTKANCLAVTGKDATRQLYMLDWTEAIVRYGLGATLPSTAVPDTILAHIDTRFNVANYQTSMAVDPFGGVFIAQNRAALDAYPMLAHFANDTCDFKIAAGVNAELAPSTCNRGAMGLSVDGSQLALGGGRAVNLYDVTYDAATHVPTLTKSAHTFAGVGSNVDGICFDIVGNIYMVSASTEKLYIYGVPTADNTFTTPANGTITVEATQAAFYNESIAFSATAAKGTLNDSVFAGESGDWKIKMTDTDSKAEIDANTAYFNMPAGITAFDYRLKVGAKSSAKNTLTATIPADGYLLLAFRTSSSSATDRNVVVTQATEIYNHIALESEATEVLYEGNKIKVFPVAKVPVTAGTATITYPVGAINFYGFAYATVEPTINELTPYVYAESVALNKKALTLEEDEEETLTATVNPANASRPELTWTLTDSAIVSVVGGAITALKAGETDVIVSVADGKKDTCHVTVTEKPIFYPNIYAHGLKSTFANGLLAVEYVLNAPATAVKLIATQGETETEFTLNGLDYGKNEASVDVSALPEGDYTWAIRAEAELVAVDDAVLANNVATNVFANPRGLAIDNNPENATFGNVYVGNGGATAEVSGIYMYDALLAGGETLYGSPLYTASKASPMRIFVAEDGLLYVTDWSDDTPNIHIVDPANPTQETLVFGGTTAAKGIYTNEAGEQIHGSMSSCYVEGTGDERVLYTFDEDLKVEPQTHAMGIYRYDIGELNEDWVAAPSAIEFDNADNYEQNGNSVILKDENGGWWISQDRANDAQAIPALIHVSAEGVVDYNSNGALGGRTRGALAISNDGTLLATASDNSLRIWAVEWNEGVPTLSLDQSMTTTFGAQNSSSCYSLAFDQANNLYASGDGKNLHVWALVKEENAAITPAAAKYGFTIEPTAVENIEAASDVIKFIENGQLIIIKNGVRYNALGARL